MIARLAMRMLQSDPRLLSKFIYNFGFKGVLSLLKFQRRIRQGNSFPPFMMLSITNQCNLRCQGCWVTPSPSPDMLSFAALHRIVAECNRLGSFFFGILGGEPLLHPGLFEFIARERRSYFQVFTNGTLITAKMAREMRRLGNVTPLISVEGDTRASDERRGGKDVYHRAMEGLEHCRRQRLITGIASSVCRSNFDWVVSEHFVEEMMDRGAHYLWYYIYRPVGVNPCRHLALSQDEIIALRRFLVSIRTRVPMIVVDTYWDHKGRALCPAATGISHHINPRGDIEFCPPIQFSCDNIAEGSLQPLFQDSGFLARLRKFAGTTRGCILLRQPEILREFLLKENARDTTGRNTGYEELRAMQSCPCHHAPGQEIPEKHWAYRLAKRYWFFGFGAYG